FPATSCRYGLNSPQRLNDCVVHRIYDRISCRGSTAHRDDVHVLQERKTLLRAEYDEMVRQAAASEYRNGETRVDSGDLARKTGTVVGVLLRDAVQPKSPNGFLVSETGGLVESDGQGSAAP